MTRNIGIPVSFPKDKPNEIDKKNPFNGFSKVNYTLREKSDNCIRNRKAFPFDSERGGICP